MENLKKLNSLVNPDNNRKDVEEYCKNEYKDALKYYEKGDFETSLKNFIEIYNLFEKYNINNNNTKIEILYNIGTCQKDIGIIKDSINILLESKKTFYKILDSIDSIDSIYKKTVINFTSINTYLLKYTGNISHIYDALVYDMNNPLLYYNLGLIYHRNGLYSHSIHNYNCGLIVNKNYEDIYRELGNIYMELENYKKSKYYLENCINKINNKNLEVLNSLGLLFMKNNEFSESVKQFNRILDITKNKLCINKLRALLNKGCVFSMTGQINDSIRQNEKVIELCESSDKLIVSDTDVYEIPAELLACENILLNCHYDEKLMETKFSKYELKYNNIVKKYHSGNLIKQNFSNKIKKIGLISGDFESHAVSNFISQFLNYKKYDFPYEIILFNTNKFIKILQSDILSKNIYNIQYNTDLQVAELIRKNNIDVLIDLSGHTQYSRLSIFSYKPSRIQISYLGYPDIPSNDKLDYTIFDNYIMECFDENNLPNYNKILKMNNCFLCYDYESNKQDISNCPNDKPIIYFCCFNKINKWNNDQTLDTWNKIFEKITNGKLYLKGKCKIDIPNKYKYLKKAIINLDYSPNKQEHMKQYNKCHISLDTFPYNGTTTTCESLAMGVPVVTLVSEKYLCGRVSYSILMNTFNDKKSKNSLINLVISKNINEYINNAILLSEKISRIKDYSSFKKLISNKFGNGVVCNKKLYMNNFKDLISFFKSEQDQE